jgi:hypothetical protein
MEGPVRGRGRGLVDPCRLRKGGTLGLVGLNYYGGPLNGFGCFLLFERREAGSATSTAGVRFTTAVGYIRQAIACIGTRYPSVTADLERIVGVLADVAKPAAVPAAAQLPTKTAVVPPAPTQPIAQTPAPQPTAGPVRSRTLTAAEFAAEAVKKQPAWWASLTPGSRSMWHAVYAVSGTPVLAFLALSTAEMAALYAKHAAAADAYMAEQDKAAAARRSAPQQPAAKKPVSPTSPTDSKTPATATAKPATPKGSGAAAYQALRREAKQLAIKVPRGTKQPELAILVANAKAAKQTAPAASQTAPAGPSAVQTTAVLAVQTTPAIQAPAATARPVAGVLYVADGNGGYRPATEQEIWAVLNQMNPVNKAAA